MKKQSLNVRMRVRLQRIYPNCHGHYLQNNFDIMVKDFGSLIKDVNVIFKVVEVILCAASTGIITDDFVPVGDMMGTRTAVVTIVGYLIICLCILVSIVLEDESKQLPAILLVVGAILNIVVGILYIVSYVDNKSVSNSVIVGSLQLICGVLMAIDVFFTLKK